MSVADGSLITVIEGTEKGKTWLVDKFISNGVFKKFSGTDQAGSNQDTHGATCDAIAHFSLAITNGCFVLVDIQGK